MNYKPLRRQLDEICRKTSTRLDVIQQDYLLTWLLFGIYQHEDLKNNLVFKGGTALKKCYFGEYRFSEDLDFSARNDAPSASSLFRAISETCKEVEGKMNESAQIALYVKRYLEKSPHPNNQEAFTISAQFPWQRQPLTKVMIEISRDEVILFEAKTQPLMHTYEQEIEQELLVYSLEEIVIEKLRAILQHTKKIHERDWSRSRARDYYDLWHIFRSFENDLVFEDMPTLLREKCSNKNVEFNNVDSFYDPVMIENVLKTWDRWLGPLVTNLPNCTQVLDEVRLKIEKLFTSIESKV
ncbi:hypothetical protein COB11_08520 [Candidatus Aerophobetes bacterium]|uniref:Nucleotidyl transferase AbiEii/AbiGii toxin family protein n=1 Tax=Aerophobetes bacterium TaxID=2030807 RepID=A0A2A4Y9F2_UNCAE|nr:MAG: hypothetical protein COB11_08520 [Candidatus Aerophobetes bacterium]